MIEENIFDVNDNELLMLYQEDDENAKNLLYMKYKFIIDILIKKYSKHINDLNIDYQEIYSECSVGFSDGLRHFKDDKNASLATFITLCIERRLNAVIKKYSRDKYKIMQDSYSLDFIYNDNDFKLMDIISDDTFDPLKNMTEKEQYDELLKNIEEQLTKTEYEVFVLLARGLDYITISKILEKSPKQIDNAIQRIKSKIRKIVKK